VVRAAAGSEIPLISAVGHETDTTLIDFASDRRAPTPTAAAEIAVPVRAELLANVIDRTRRMVAATGRLLEERRVRVEGLARGLPDPVRIFEEKAQRLDDRAERLANAAANLLERRRARLAETFAGLIHPERQLRLAARDLERLEVKRRLPQVWQRFCKDRESKIEALGRILESISHKNVLKRGFVLVHGPKGLVTQAKAVTSGLELELEFADGRAKAIGGAGAAAGAGRKPKPGRKAGPGDDTQGSLL